MTDETALVAKKLVCDCKTRGKDTKNPTCQRPAGWGTPHPGQGPCKLHGGATPKTSGTWRYSKITATRVQQLYEQFENDPDPLNTLGELAMGRALAVDFIERYDAWRDALLAWHASFTKVGALNAMIGGGLSKVEKPREVLDLSDAVRHLDTITKMVERIEKARAANAISRKDLVKLMMQFGNVIEQRVREAIPNDEAANKVLRHIDKDVKQIVAAS